MSALILLVTESKQRDLKTLKDIEIFMLAGRVSKSKSCVSKNSFKNIIFGGIFYEGC